MKKEKVKSTNDEIVDYINSKYGEGYIFKLPPKDSKYNPSNFISSGSYCFNELITGNYKCGFPRGRMVEIYGPEGSGKTTLALSASKEISNIKKKILYCDIEHGLNSFYASQLNIDRDYFYFIQPEYGEQAFTIVEDLINKFNFDLFVLDSIGGVSTRAQLDGDYGEANMGSQARLISKAVGRLAPILMKKNIAAIFINQLRASINTWGKSEDTAGGKKLKFYLWTRIEVRAPRGKKVLEKTKGNIDDVIEVKNKDEKEKGKEIGTILNLKTVKNKLFIPYRTCNIKIIYGRGIDKENDFILFLESRKIIQFKKSKLIYNNKKYSIKKFLYRIKEDTKFKKEIQEKII